MNVAGAKDRQFRCGPSRRGRSSARSRLTARPGSTASCVADRPERPARAISFGREVRDALARRQQWLIGAGSPVRSRTGSASTAPTSWTGAAAASSSVCAGQLSGALGLGYAEARPGERIEGVYRRRSSSPAAALP